MTSMGIFLLLALGAALLCSVIGFKRFVWFLSIGYGYAVAGIALCALAYGATKGLLTVGTIAGLAVCALYGIRLGTFLLRRETRNMAYKKILDQKAGKEPPFFVKFVCWVLCGVLYVCQTAGLHLRMMNGTKDDLSLYIGIGIMVLGALIEAIADKQKSAQKAQRPDMVATKGLFRMVRCPNYFGEILFWIGVTVCGVTSFAGWWQWAAAAFGFVCIMYVMLDGAKRMEKGHIARYGENPEYQEYANKTPLIIPLIPLYHLYDPAKDKKLKKQEQK